MNKMLIALLLLLFAVIYIMYFLRQPKFGKMAEGTQKDAIVKSSHYSNGEFQNLSKTPDLTEGANMFTVMFKFFFGKGKRNKPTDILPSIKTNLNTLQADENAVVWFGHSSYFIQVDGRKFLVDPVFSGAASPIAATTRSFPGSDVYTVDDLPEIDCLFITHDHWDHLDYDTMLKLNGKVKTIVCGLGVRAHLEYWGFDPEIIIEKDLDESVDLGGGFSVITAPARHFSGRTLKRNQSLWMSYVLLTPHKKLYLGGDSGYDSHFKRIGSTYGPFNVAFLECGQYNENWKYIHMQPEEVIQAAKDLGVKALFPVHWGKFSLALHDWDEPIIRVTAAAKNESLLLVSPMIGEKTDLDNMKASARWWLTVR